MFRWKKEKQKKNWLGSCREKLRRETCLGKSISFLFFFLVKGEKYFNIVDVNVWCTFELFITVNSEAPVPCRTSTWPVTYGPFRIARFCFIRPQWAHYKSFIVVDLMHSPYKKKTKEKNSWMKIFFFTLFGSDFMSSVLMHEYCPNFLIIQIKTSSKRRNEKWILYFGP